MVSYPALNVPQGVYIRIFSKMILYAFRFFGRLDKRFLTCANALTNA